MNKYIADKLGRPELLRVVPRLRIARLYARRYLRLLDHLAWESGRDVWVEKTPDHLRFIETIERYAPGARFVHVIRNGEDVVASLYQVRTKYPDTWRGTASVEGCIRQWNESIAITRKHMGTSNHHIVRYEALVQSPQRVLEDLCGFLKVPYDARMMAGRIEATRRLVKNEPWKSGNINSLYYRPRYLFSQIFSQEDQDFILERLDSIEDLAPLPSG